MMNTYVLKTRLRLLFELPPKVVLQKIRKRFKGHEMDEFVLEDVVEPELTVNKHLRPQRMINFLWRYETIIRRVQPSWNLNFSGQRVLEVGGGPLLGLAPIALFLGGEHYCFVEPSYNARILEHPKAKEYFRGVHEDLCALYGERMGLEEFLRLLKERVYVQKKTLEAFEDSETYSIVFSNAVFEHIQDVPAAVQKLKRLSAENSTFIHLVNFGNHRESENPFGGLYTRSKEEYWKTYGKGINTLRANDILRCLMDAGFSTTMIPYVVVERLKERPNEWWKAHHTDDELRCRVALFVNTPTA